MGDEWNDMGTFVDIMSLLQGGLGNLGAYLAAHVLLCLLPAFFVAGALTALVPKESITRYLGRDAPKFVSYPAAALGGFVLAVCSCTIMPLFAGIYKKGAGLGPAIAFLFVGPAINILALTYTGVAIGMDIALARVILTAFFGIGIGLIMALIFREDDVARAQQAANAFASNTRVTSRVWILMTLLIALLIVGTLQVGWLTDPYARITMPIQGVDDLQAILYRWAPFDASKGEEGITVQGAVLIGFLMLIGLASWLGLNEVDQGYNRWTWVALGLTTLTLVVAATRWVARPAAVDVYLTGRVFGVIALLILVWYAARRSYDDNEIQEWLWETWRFVKQIFPLLLVGVFAVGVIRQFIRTEWIQALAGRNTLVANLVGVLFGVFMYFPTLVEVPIAKMFLGLGMHRGPLLAYLISDPELSLQSILITAGIIGKTKAWVYVGWVTVFSTLAGWLFGAWVDGASAWIIVGALAAGLAVLLVVLNWIGTRTARKTAPVGTRS